MLEALLLKTSRKLWPGRGSEPFLDLLAKRVRRRSRAPCRAGAGTSRTRELACHPRLRWREVCGKSTSIVFDRGEDLRNLGRLDVRK